MDFVEHAGAFVALDLEVQLQASGGRSAAGDLDEPLAGGVQHPRLNLSRGRLATNAGLVERAVTILESMNVQVLGPTEVRDRLELTRHG